jgi:prolipoprotein diacylglyceryltransferase
MGKDIVRTSGGRNMMACWNHGLSSWGGLIARALGLLGEGDALMGNSMKRSSFWMLLCGVLAF